MKKYLHKALGASALVVGTILLVLALGNLFLRLLLGVAALLLIQQGVILWQGYEIPLPFGFTSIKTWWVQKRK